ncbi:hypothetical protein [Micromonospora pisi]|uniref:hypothetical protein n=1 Tax=Micromonospora pisi TaxID=589240 RepID=UPI000EACBEBC|nr:hypothetical protein [Micromonospora pisi]
MPEPRFELDISEVFAVTGRPVIVNGSTSQGLLRNGERVDVVRNGQVVATAQALIEIHARPGTTSLVLLGLDAAHIRPGDVVRAQPGHG